MNDLPDAIDQLESRIAARIKTLELRVFALEHPSPAASPTPAEPPSPTAAAPLIPALSFAQAGGMFPVLGKAMLGIAGAYLLRAVAETKVAPQAAVASLAIVYAILWLVWAARTRVDAWFASITYACTSALILAPMLWELTLRFKVLAAPATAAALAAFVASAFVLTGKQNRAPVLWLANGTASALAIALSIASHQIAPFAAVLLLTVLLSECGAAFNRWGSIRILAAAAADFAIWILIYIYASPQTTRMDYPALSATWLIAPSATLFLIFAVSIVVETALRRKSITAFETIQTTIAFLLAAAGLFYFGPTTAVALLGRFCIAISVAGYALVFSLFSNANRARNSTVFATWSAALFLTGSLLCAPTPWASAVLAVAAVIATIAGARLSRLALEFHGAAYLLAAAISSGLLTYLFSALTGAMPGAPAAIVCAGAACAVLCYGSIKPSASESWKPQLLHLVFASIAAGAVTSLLVEGLAGLITLHVQPAAHHLAFIRTLVLCTVALALAFAGGYWHRRELTRIGYAVLALVAIKLVAEDLPLGHLAYIAASIFLFALTLIAVPRVARMRHRA